MITPGVYVTTSVRSGVAGTVRAISGQFFIAAMFERGPVDAPVQVRGMADVTRIYGGRTTYSDGYDQLATFFAEGGKQAQVLRIAGTEPTAGTLTLKDQGATSQDTLKITASSPGSWSSNLTVEVSDGPVADTYRVTVRLNGQTVEDYNSLSTVADAVNKFSTSNYIRVTNLGSTNAAPANIPANVSPTALTAGDDKRASVNENSYIAGLDLFDEVLGDGAVAIPGQSGPAVHAALVAHAEATNRIALLASSRGAAMSDLQSAAAAVNSEYAGLFAPWVNVPLTGGGTRAISPEGYVAAVRARAHETVGPWRKPAGNIAKAQYVTGVDDNFGKTVHDTLYASRVNTIRINGTNIRLYGWRSLSIDEDNWADLKDRDLINRLTVAASELLENYLFDTIDSKGHLLAAIESALVGLVDPISKADGLYPHYDTDGNQIDPGYSVTVAAGSTTDSALRNEVHATLAVRVAPSGDLVTLSIVKVGLEASF